VADVVSTLTFGPSGAPLADQRPHFGDISHDGFPDLPRISARETGIARRHAGVCHGELL
jgi:hypothetical protein